MGMRRGQFKLHEACAKGDSGMVVRLLQGGWDPDAGDAHGAAPLHVACGAGHGGVVALLLTAGADPNGLAFESECSALHVAAAVDNHVGHRHCRDCTDPLKTPLLPD